MVQETFDVFQIGEENSDHLEALVDRGLVTRELEGIWNGREIYCYRAVDEFRDEYEALTREWVDG
jgi:predicted transcriptional regulator